MARPKKQPDFDISWENSNRQYQVHQLLSRSASFQNDAKHIRQKYGLSERGFELTETEKKDFIEDVKKILAKVKMPGDYAGIVTSLILGDKPEYIGWMKELPKQPRNKQFRVKRQLMKNLMIYHLVRERKMSYKQVADYINGFHDFIDDKGCLLYTSRCV